MWNAHNTRRRVRPRSQTSNTTHHTCTEGLHVLKILNLKGLSSMWARPPIPHPTCEVITTDSYGRVWTVGPNSTLKRDGARSTSQTIASQLGTASEETWSSSFVTAPQVCKHVSKGTSLQHTMHILNLTELQACGAARARGKARAITIARPPAAHHKLNKAAGRGEKRIAGGFRGEGHLYGYHGKAVIATWRWTANHCLHTSVLPDTGAISLGVSTAQVMLSKNMITHRIESVRHRMRGFR